MTESETEQKHNAVLQELEDDYEKRLADKARQLEDKVRFLHIGRNPVILDFELRPSSTSACEPPGFNVMNQLMF